MSTKYDLIIDDKNNDTIEYMLFDGDDALMADIAFKDIKGIKSLSSLSNDEALPLVVSAYRNSAYHIGTDKEHSIIHDWDKCDYITAKLKNLCMMLIENKDTTVKVYHAQ